MTTGRATNFGLKLYHRIAGYTVTGQNGSG